MVAVPSAMALLLLTSLQAPEPLPFVYEFDEPFALAEHPDLLASGDTQFSLVPGRDGGQALQLANQKPGRYATLTLNRPFLLDRNQVLSFACRAEVIGEGRAGYVGILAFSGDKQFFGNVPFVDEWQTYDLPLASLSPVNGGELKVGLPIDKINLYGRANGDEQILMRVAFDDLSLTVRPAQGRLTDKVRTSNANPPLFEWPLQSGLNRLSISRDPSFPDGQTIAFETPRNWTLSDRALEPGKWYWRYGLDSDLSDGWSDIAAVEIPVRAHRFQAGSIPADLTARPHPRLPVPPTDAAAKAALKKSAANEYQAGVPDEIPIWVEGDPRWPTWIEWYGLVHGNMTSRAGTRLQRLGDDAARCDDPEVTQWCAELALKAASWDPDGGSAMHRGDIGAHHLLRGLVHCYDALAGKLPADQLAPLKDAIVARAKQFSGRLLPFRGNEFNNHAWLQAFGLAEAGLVMAGDVREAEDWAQYCLDLFVGRFLCALGYDGDNNEGIGYWGYGLSFVTPYAQMMREVCGIDLFQHPWLAQTARFPIYTAVPHQHAVSFADTTQPNFGVVGPAATSQVRALGIACQDPYALWYSGASAAIDGVQPKAPVDLPPSKLFDFIGWAVFNTDLVDGRDGVTVAMRSGPFYAGHQHEDLNSFVIYAYGEPVAIDGGHYDWYGSPQFTKWSTLTRAHNTLLIDGLDQNSRRAGADGKIVGWLDAPGVGLAIGETGGPMVYNGLLNQFQRRLLFLKPDIVIVHDRVNAVKKAVQSDWLLHTVGEIQTAGEAFSFQVGQASLSGKVVSGEPTPLSVETGYPADAQPVDRYSTRPSPPERTPLEYHLHAKPPAGPDQEILVAMRVTKGEPKPLEAKPVPVEHGIGTSIFTREEHVLVLSRTEPGGDLGSDRLATDGQMLAYSSRSGNPELFLMVDGTYLTESGTVQVRSSNPATIALERSPIGFRLDINASQPTTITVPTSPASGWLDGQPVAAKDGGVAVPAGQHTLVLAGTFNDLASHEAAPLLVRHGEQEASLAGYASRRTEGFQVTHWGTVTTDRAEIVTIEAEGDLDRIEIDGHDAVLGEPLTLAAGAHLILARHQGTLRGLHFGVSRTAPVEATMLPKDAGLDGAIWVEAEQPTAEGDVKGKLIEKVGASGGVAHCVWDTDGQWAEWTITVPADGAYRLVIRGAGDDGDALRAVSLDGQPWSEAAVVRLAPTGGWCRETDDWRIFEVPKDMQLAAGEHLLRLRRLSGSMNLDRIGVVRR